MKQKDKNSKVKEKQKETSSKDKPPHNNNKRKLQNIVLKRIINNLEEVSKSTSILIVILLLVSFTLNSQSIYNENFDNRDIDKQGWVFENDTASWNHSNSSLANGTIGEVLLKPRPFFKDSTKIISPKITLNNVKNLTINFKHTLKMRQTGHKIGVAVRYNNTGWLKVWEKKATTTNRKEMDILIGDIDSTDNFQFCFFYSSPSNKLTYWAIDDITLYEKKQIDLSIKNIIINSYIEPNEPIIPQIQVFNTGFTNKTFNLKCQIFDIDSNLIYFSDRIVDSLNINEKRTLKMDTFITPNAIDQAFRIYASIDLNTDQRQENNFLEKYIYSYASYNRDLILFEMGTATWCSLCPKSDDIVEEYLENNKNIAYIAYHSNDDFSFDASSNRIDFFYNMEGFPTNVFDGQNRALGFSSSTKDQYELFFNQRNNIKTGLELNLTSEIIDNNYNIQLNISKVAPFFNPNTVAHLVITESHIEKKWQNKNELNHVCRKLFPNEYGIKIDLRKNDNILLNYTFKPDDSWNLDELEVVAFIQDNNSKEVLNTTKLKLKNLLATINSDENDIFYIKSWPNPITSNSYLSFNLPYQSKAILDIIDLNGNTVVNILSGKLNSGIHNVKWEVKSSLPTGIYFARLILKDKIVITKLIKN